MERVTIIQGENAVRAEPNVMIATLLGSCVGVCLFDPVVHVGGLNHFLLGEPAPDQKISQAELQSYGVHAMELLINGMMRRGAKRERLKAHVYGGGNILSGLGTIGSNNVRFAMSFLKTEQIEICHSDVGGDHARKVEFLPYEGKSRCLAVRSVKPDMIQRPVPIPGGDLELF